MLLHYDQRLLSEAGCLTQDDYLAWLLAQPVAALALDARVENALESLGIWTIGELAATRPEELRAAHQLGADSLRSVRATVRRVLTTGRLPEPEDNPQRDGEIESSLEQLRAGWSAQEEYGRRVTRCGVVGEPQARLPATHWGNRIYG